jgi:DNA-binding GntR family transcriptional regulator
MALHGVDISRTPSAGALVFEALRRAIIKGELKDGDPIRQDEIARLFNISRIPVREAIARLEQNGLVKIHRFKGAVVAGLSIAEAGEIFDFRCLVEAQVIRRAIPRMTPLLIEELREICSACEAATDPIRWGDLNRQFHATLYQSSGLPFHLATLDNAMDRLDRYLRAQLLLTDGYARANVEHRGIIDACALGDADAAEVLIVTHIQSAHAALREHLGRIQTQSDQQDDA